jgi:hypothetical protein
MVALLLDCFGLFLIMLECVVDVGVDGVRKEYLILRKRLLLVSG